MFPPFLRQVLNNPDTGACEFSINIQISRKPEFASLRYRKVEIAGST